MELSEVVELAFPAYPRQTIASATGRSSVLALATLHQKLASQPRANYGDLVKFGNRSTGPGVVLTAAAQAGLVRFFSRGTTEFKEALERRAAKGLGWVGYRGWQSALEIDSKGRVSFAEGRQVPIKALRHEFLKD